MNKRTAYIVFLCLILRILGTSQLLYAQIGTAPLLGNEAQRLHWETQAAADKWRKAARATAVAADTFDIDQVRLPYTGFFDDFSRSSVTPDTTKWEKGGGAYVNHTFPYDPPTINVATLDGLQANGDPYSATRDANGRADVLTSLPIRFGNINDTNSVYLSFYWQAGGITKELQPEEDDSLVLQFKGPDNNWYSVLSKNGRSESNLIFTFEMVRVPTRFQYNGFQFRFVTYGGLWANVDIWHIDYVYLNKGRNAQDVYFKDIAFSTPPTQLFYPYNSIPYNHLMPGIKSQLNSRVEAVLKSFNPTPRSFTTSFKFVNETQNQVLATATDSIAGSSEIIGGRLVPRVLSVANRNYDIPNLQAPASLLHTFITADTGKGAGIANAFPYNDTVSTRTKLYDYYAYDDGSAELTRFAQQSYGALAYRFMAYKPDTLTHIDICFPVSLQNTGTAISFKLMVWKHLAKVKTKNNKVHDTDSVLVRTEIIDFKPTRGSLFQVLKLSRPVPVDGEFFVGWIQAEADKKVVVGLDINSTAPDSNLYSGTSSVWSLVNLDRFALMIHPVMGRTGSPVSIAPQEDVLQAKVYPNPTTGLLSISGPVTSVYIYDLSGKMLLHAPFEPDQSNKLISMQQWAQGMYIAHLIGPHGQKTVKKIILQNQP